MKNFKVLLLSFLLSVVCFTAFSHPSYHPVEKEHRIHQEINNSIDIQNLFGVKMPDIIEDEILFQHQTQRDTIYKAIFSNFRKVKHKVLSYIPYNDGNSFYIPNKYHPIPRIINNEYILKV